MNPLRHKRLLTALIAALLALALTACGDDDGNVSAQGDGGSGNAASNEGDVLSIEHAQGTTDVPFQPQRVVVFDVGALVTLDEFGVEVAGVPTLNSLPESLQKYSGSDYTKVGTLFEPDYEEVNALEPDLIIVAGRSAAVYPDLAKIAATIDLTVDSENFLESLRTRTETLGTIFGLEDEVAARLDDLDSQIEDLNRVASDAGTGLIVLTTGGEVSAFGPGSRFGIIHDVFGVKPAVEDVEAATHGDAVSFEFILEANPDLLYVIDRDATIGEEGATAQQVLDNELVARTTAWTNDDVTYLDGFAWYIAPNGLGSLQTMIDDVRSSLE